MKTYLIVLQIVLFALALYGCQKQPAGQQTKNTVKISHVL